MNIFYGVSGRLIDVTNICVNQLTRQNIMTIPSGDEQRAAYFTDPLVGSVKKIYIIQDDTLSVYEQSQEVQIDCTDWRTADIHSKLRINYGSFRDELPEQKMVVRYLTGAEKVLEIGGNIGRNSLVIAQILRNSAHLVTLESDPDIANQLRENRDLNHLDFHVESSALSNRRLIQRGWETVVSDTLEDGYKWVDTITLPELRAKYDIEFDTLVLDCEGAFYYILMDMPEILVNVNLVIMENDYWDINKKRFVDSVLTTNGFSVDYSEGGGWGPCADYFYEVWKKR